MLTIEMLRQSQALKGMTDEQLAAVAEMSRNDENTVLGTRIGELHGRYDADIMEVTGLKKNDGEKSYDFNKRVLGEYKKKAESAAKLKTDLDSANALVAELNEKLAKGASDEALARKLKDEEAKSAKLQASVAKAAEDMAKAKKDYDESLKAVHVDYAFKTAVQGLKYKDGITDAVLGVLFESAKREVLAKGTPDFTDDGKGGKVLVFRGADGNILSNPKNNLNPYTFKELVMETSLKDIIDTAPKQQGAGTGPNAGPTGKNGTDTALDLSGVKSQVEADRAIEAHLLANGLTRDSQEFANQSLQLRTENNVGDLPLR